MSSFLPEEDVFYEHLLKYLMTDQEKWDNNYPKESADNPGVAVYKERKGSPDCKSCISALIASKLVNLQKLPSIFHTVLVTHMLTVIVLVGSFSLYIQ